MRRPRARRAGAGRIPWSLDRALALRASSSPSAWLRRRLKLGYPYPDTALPQGAPAVRPAARPGVPVLRCIWIWITQFRSYEGSTVTCSDRSALHTAAHAQGFSRLPRGTPRGFCFNRTKYQIYLIHRSNPQIQIQTQNILVTQVKPATSC